MIRNAFAALAVTLFALSPASVAHAGMWVSTELGDVPADQLVKIDSPQPVQLLFQFETNGAPNARAVAYLKGIVADDVKTSGVFSDVTETPAANGAILSITFNDVFDKKGMESKGFGTGLTLGLHGTIAYDDYAATAEYLPSGGAAKITAEAHHKLYSVIGVKSPPPDAVKVKNADEGMHLIAAQLVAHLVNDIAKQPGFTGAATVAMAPAAPSAEATATLPPVTEDPAAPATAP